ncbi:hypothetical protein RIF29_27753 [Crotalaria pallida]|uniref:Uncharacterized protein n=1 Tax=Crotalaria pallida TaxID=3830 RepID=A0AAN9EQB8_CROPI
MVATNKLETMKRTKTELLNLLDMAYKERNEARDQLHKLVNKLIMPSTTITTSNELKKVLVQVHQHESLVMLQHAINKANSGITDSLSHVSSSPIDSSSHHEFSNMNNNVVVDSHNNFGGSVYCLNQQQPASSFVSCEKPSYDVANEVIDCLSKGKVLPQQGKLLQAVIDAGPLLSTLILAGPLPTWRNPPPFQAIKVPPPKVVGKDFTNHGIEQNSLANNWNSFQKSTSLVSSPSMLNFAGNTNNISGSWNNTWKLTYNGSAKNHATPSRIQQIQHQGFS